MVVWQWVEGAAEARLAERALIRRYLVERTALLNIESATLGAQIPLL
jgi:hypothetical protein